MKILELLNLVKSDGRTTIVSNLRNIMLYAWKNTIYEMLNSKIDVKYHKLEEEWRTPFLGKIIDILHGEKLVDGFLLSGDGFSSKTNDFTSTVILRLL